MIHTVIFKQACIHPDKNVKLRERNKRERDVCVYSTLHLITSKYYVGS